MVVHSEIAEERLEKVIRPYVDALKDASLILESKDWDNLIEYAGKIGEGELSLDDLKECRSFGEVFDLDSREKEYASRLGEVGLLVPEDAWKDKFLKDLRMDDAEAVHIEGNDFTGPFGITGLSLTPDNKEFATKEVDVVHESLHSAFSKYSFFYESKQSGFENSKSADDILKTGVDYVEIDIINEMNSYRSEPKDSWSQIYDIIMENYLPTYTGFYVEAELLDKVYDLPYLSSDLDIDEDEMKKRDEVRETVEKAFEKTSEKVRKACDSLSLLEKKYSNGLISHIIYNCSSLDDLIGFESRKDLKQNVIESLSAYSKADSFYKNAYDEAKLKLA